MFKLLKSHLWSSMNELLIIEVHQNRNCSVVSSRLLISKLGRRPFIFFKYFLFRNIVYILVILRSMNALSQVFIYLYLFLPELRFLNI